MIDNDDINRIKEVGDGRWVQIDDCEKITARITKTVTTNNTDIAVIKTQMKVLLWVLTTIGSIGIGLLAKIAFGG